MTTWLVGAGPMAAAHAAVLRDIGEPFTVVGLSEARARALAETYGVEWLAGGIEAALAAREAPRRAVIALPVEWLANATTALIGAGVHAILVEKPGGLASAEIGNLADLGERVGARLNLAYNRRFLASIQEARRRIEQAGGALSIYFEFTEMADRIVSLPTPAHVKQRWLLGNSSHVIDLAFHLSGNPVSLSHDVQASLPWHKAGAVFRGFGNTDRGTAFSYAADWRGPGRWGIEIVLPDERLVLRPLEKLQSVPRGRFEPEPVALRDTLDLRFKPGVHEQMTAFLADKAGVLPTMREHHSLVSRIVEPMAGYDRPFDARARPDGEMAADPR